MDRHGNQLNDSGSKSIVICSDGTGNHDINARGTNVFKLYEAVDIQGHLIDPNKQRQVAIYDNGVGTDGPLPFRLLCGAVGLGFSANVRYLYRALLEVYEDGDKIYLFGFSRGAYTVRALAGLIGMRLEEDAHWARNRAQSEIDTRVKESWKEFKAQAMSRKSAKSAGNATARKLVTFLGVWDTVGALGFPLVDWTNPRHRRLRKFTGLFPWFDDNHPCKTVERACQALALDDQRATFRPELWNENNEPNPSHVKQVWFAGVHSNVGGGYPRQGISLVSLDWMMAEAEAAGLRFILTDREAVRAHSDVHDKLYDSRAGLAVYYRWRPRNSAALSRDQNIARPVVHESVFQRIARGTDGYAPLSVPLPCTVLWTNPPGSETPTYSREFDATVDKSSSGSAEALELGTGEKLRAFFTDYVALQVGFGLIVGVFCHAQLAGSHGALQAWLDANMTWASEHFVLLAILSSVLGLTITRGLASLLGWWMLSGRGDASPQQGATPSEARAPYRCLIEVVGSTIAAGNRSYRLFVTTTVMALLALLCGSKWGVALSLGSLVKLRWPHAELVGAILVLMALLAWGAGASVDKRLAKVSSEFWRRKRDDIRNLFAFGHVVTGAPRGGSISARVPVGTTHDRSEEVESPEFEIGASEASTR
ncbi:MAG: DUF2235 domain-containing protein [Polyangiaceae bacterium]